MWAIYILLGVILGFILRGMGAKKNPDATTKKCEILLIDIDEIVNKLESLSENADKEIKESLGRKLAKRGIKISEEQYLKLFNEIKDKYVAELQRLKKNMEKAKIELELIL